MRRKAGKPAELGEWRKVIDRLDSRIVDLLGKRAKCAVEIGKIKSLIGAPVLDQKREAEVISRLKKLNNALPSRSLEAIYREIFSASRAIEKPTSDSRKTKKDAVASLPSGKPVRVAYLGPAGTFSNEAATEIFGPSSAPLPCPDFPSIFKEVEEGRADRGILPVENSVGGTVDGSLDLLSLSTLQIVGEKTMQVHQVLASKLTSTRKIKLLFSHQQPLNQCRRFIADNLPGVSIVGRASTADAAAEAAKTPNSAAICSLVAVKKYELGVLNRHVEDFPSFTRFLVLSTGVSEPTGRDKTSLAVTIKNRPGELYKLLGIFNGAGINLTMIVSRPIPGSNWGYQFFIDFEGHQNEKPARLALKKVSKMGESLKILGSYPREK